ncbi:MAG: hypothetical protein U0Z26_09235 [Anaerolineales bacterium]
MNDIYILIGKIIAYGGGTVALAYAVFMFLGKKWIESKFEERLVTFKHAQEQELEKYRQQVNILLSRVSKIHEKEIDVLPELWHKLQSALGNVGSLTSPLQFYPDFNRMSQENFDEFLKTTKLNEPDKKLLATVHDKNDFYQKTIFWYNLRDAKISVQEFRNFMAYNRIFLSKDLKVEFEKIDELMAMALANRETGEIARDYKMISEAYKGLGKEAESVVERIENLVQERLEFTKANVP